MKKQEETKKTEQKTENKVVYVATSINTCIACGREIPEGMLVCMKCEKGLCDSKCTICDAPLKENEVGLCTRCRATFFRSKNKDQ